VSGSISLSEGASVFDHHLSGRFAATEEASELLCFGVFLWRIGFSGRQILDYSLAIHIFLDCQTIWRMPPGRL